MLRANWEQKVEDNRFFLYMLYGLSVTNQNTIYITALTSDPGFSQKVMWKILGLLCLLKSYILEPERSDWASRKMISRRTEKWIRPATMRGTDPLIRFGRPTGPLSLQWMDPFFGPSAQQHSGPTPPSICVTLQKKYLAHLILLITQYLSEKKGHGPHFKCQNIVIMQ